MDFLAVLVGFALTKMAGFNLYQISLPSLQENALVSLIAKSSTAVLILASFFT
jgi:hypothetical protein